MAKWMQLGLSDPGTSVMAQLVSLHDFALMIGALVMCFVVVGIVSVIFNKMSCRSIYASHQIEVLWTVMPAVILFFLAFPSIRLLYAMDEVVDPSFTVKVVGHQWYWSYEYGDFGESPISFDSYMVSTDLLSEGGLRLLEVDNPLVLPTLAHVRVILTSSDVIHSWAVPSLGMKMDAVPGRLNQMSFFIEWSGVYRGMCSELCGINHGYMPIVINAVSAGDFIKWVEASMDTDF